MKKSNEKESVFFEANRKNIQNIDYLSKNWNTQVLQKYLTKLEEIIIFLEKDILQAKFNADLGLHKALISSQIYLFYEIKEDIILIVTTWNNYKKPYWL